MLRQCRCWHRSASSGSCQPALEPTDRAAQHRHMLIKQCACVEVVLMKVHAFMPAQVAAALQADPLPAIQARVAKLQGPANVAVAWRHLIGAFEGVVDLLDIAVELGKVGAQGREAADVMQRVAKADVVAVQVTQLVEGVRIEPGKARRYSAVGPTCLAVSIKLTLSDPTGRVLWASCVSFSRFVHSVLHGDPVLYDNHFGFTGIP